MAIEYIHGCTDNTAAERGLALPPPPWAKRLRKTEAPLAAPLEAFGAQFPDGRPFVGGDQPAIAAIRWAVTLEFLRAIDYDFPACTEEYMARVEDALCPVLNGDDL